MNKLGLAAAAAAAIVVVPCLAAVAPAQATGANLIIDGQFNDSTSSYFPGTQANTEESAAPDPSATGIPGWTVTSGSVDWVSSTYWNGPTATDNYTIDLNGSSAGALEQTVATTAGHSYTLSFDLSANPNCGGAVAGLAVDWNGSPVAPDLQVTPTWDNATMTYTPQSFTVSGTGSDVLDLVSTTDSACGPVIADVSLVDNAGAPNTAPSLSAPATASATYGRAMSPITASGSDSDGDTVTLGALNLPAGLSFNATTGALSGTATAAPGPYTVTFTADDGVNAQVTKQTVITIAQDTCSLTGPLTIQSSASGPTSLTAMITQAGTGVGLAGKSVAFALTDASNNPYGPYAANSGATGVVSTTAPLPAGVYSMSESFAGDVDYQACASQSPTIVTVTPAGYKATGGGWFSNGTGRTSFGFNVMSSVDGLNGQIQVHTNKGDFHGNTVSSLSQPVNNSVSWTGAGRWNGLAATFTATVVGGSKATNSISLSISVAGKVVWTTGPAQQLKGGNIAIH